MAENTSTKILVSKARLRRFLPLLVVIVGIIVVVALGRLRGKQEPPMERQIPVVNVVTVEVQPQEVRDVVSLPGFVQPWSTTVLAAEIGGKIEQVAVREGDTIAPRQPLIHLDDDLLRAEHDQARAKAEYDARDLERLTRAAAGGVATPMEVDIARTATAASQAALEVAAARLARTIIYAPPKINGTVGPEDVVGILDDLPVDVGEYIREGTTVATVVNIEAVKIRVDVPERDVRKLAVGQTAQVYGPNVPEGLEGEIIFISSVADQRTRTFRTELKVLNPDKLLRGEMTVNVRLLRQVLPEAMMIPLDAVIPLEHGHEVFVVKDDVAQRRRVRLGLIRQHMVQVLPLENGEPGLEFGDRLIIQGQRLVGHGQPVAERAEVANGLLTRAAINGGSLAPVMPSISAGEEQ